MTAGARYDLLRASAAGYAGLAAAQLARIAPQAVGADGFDAWRRHYESHVRVLASALEDAAPERYAEHVAWLRDARLAREGDPALLVAAFDALVAVLEQELPPPCGEDLLRCMAAARARLASPAFAPQIAPSGDPLVCAYLDAVLALDRVRALGVVDDALAHGAASRASVIDGLLPAAQRHIGALWHAGALSVAHEHFATEVARDCIARLVARAAVTAAPDAPRVVVSGVQGDAHDLGVRLAAAAFELAGWRVVFLGTNTPIDELAAFARELDAGVVALGATLDEHRAAVTAAVVALRRARPGLRVLVGGSAFAGTDALWRRTGADAHVVEPSQAPRLAAG